MNNPFQFGGVIGPDCFCNREQEFHELSSAMRNGEKVFLYSERRFGKTSLVTRCLANLPDKEFMKAYIDLWATDSEETFVAAMAKAITESLTSTPAKLIQTAAEFFQNLVPTLTVDDEGKPKLEFGMRSRGASHPALDEVLEAPERIRKRRKKNVVIVFDEFQQVLSFSSDDVERRLRSHIQHHQHVSYFFLGSRKHLIQELFLNRTRPLYRIGRHYPLARIAVEHWVPFICDKFSKARKNISETNARHIVELTDGHPFYTQHLCHALWDLCEAEVTPSLIQSALETLLQRESYAFVNLWESLTVNQRRILLGLAKNGGHGEGIFSTEFISTNRLGTASSVQRAIKTLVDRDILDREGERVVIIDRFLRLWINRLIR